MQTPNPSIRATQCALAAAAVLLGTNPTSATALPPKPASEPANNSTERHGQVKFTSDKEQIVGEIAIRHDAGNFHAEITKGPGLPLLTITAKFGTPKEAREVKERQMTVVRVSGPLSHGGWTWRPNDLLTKKSSNDSLKDHSRAWAALPEVFMWGEAEAKKEAFRVTFPDVAMHARTGDGAVRKFDYSRHANPTGEPLPLKDLKKQKVLETVICHLD